jgi:hypothetical protein
LPTIQYLARISHKEKKKEVKNCENVYVGFAEKVVCEEREQGIGNREQGTVSTIWISSISHIRQGKMQLF